MLGKGDREILCLLYLDNFPVQNLNVARWAPKNHDRLPAEMKWAETMTGEYPKR